jgi:hypothetical protein
MSSLLWLHGSDLSPCRFPLRRFWHETMTWTEAAEAAEAAATAAGAAAGAAPLRQTMPYQDQR